MKRKNSRVRKTRKYKKRGGSSMEISYPKFKVDNQEVSEKDTTYTPTIKLYPIRYSTLIMYDPDANMIPYLHLLIINIKNGNINTGDIIVTYAKPTPPPGTGNHRYIFEQLEQSSPFTFAMPERDKFNIENFKKQHNLALKATKMFHINA
jgi:phosphatidylethanolamine-binding protein (PEBP) family uncharacterized protein